MSKQKLNCLFQSFFCHRWPKLVNLSPPLFWPFLAQWSGIKEKIYLNWRKNFDYDVAAVGNISFHNRSMIGPPSAAVRKHVVVLKSLLTSSLTSALKRWPGSHTGRSPSSWRRGWGGIRCSSFKSAKQLRSDMFSWHRIFLNDQPVLRRSWGSLQGSSLRSRCWPCPWSRSVSGPVRSMRSGQRKIGLTSCFLTLNPSSGLWIQWQNV